MLFLVFQLGKDRYALDANQISEVLPVVDIKELPQAPPGVVGVFDLRGAPVPVLDLSQLALGSPAPRLLSTRLVIVHYPDDRGDTRLLGLILEKATETVRRDPTDFADSGITIDRALYLGPVATDTRGLLQRVDVSTLLPASAREVLFTRPTEQPWRSPSSKTC